MTDLHHYGVKGMKWGVRRNNDKISKSDDANKFRKRYDDIKRDQIMSERAYTINSAKTPIKSVNKFINNHNSNYYNKKANSKLKALKNTIGERGISEIDKIVMQEGKTFAEKALKKAEEINKSLNLDIKGNELFLIDTKKEYDRALSKYLKNNLVKR